MSERWVQDAIHVAQDWLTVAALRWEVARLKLLNYDTLVDNLRGLRRVIQTLERSVGELNQQIDARNAQIESLRTEYATLKERAERAEAASARNERQALFARLQPIATQLPTLRAAVAQGGAVSAKDVLGLLTPLDDMLRDLGYQPIGEAGAELEYDPTRHRAVGRGARSVEPGARVRVRYVGYLHEGRVACKAEVTSINAS
jgi:molecular chaperone GrpE (heat shock protein)